ncbi:unnamed protein product [Owenia fusiformis]|uniref:Peptidase S8/S53 domain-containing protein n=1 Tax=Owenia fusiformis TaxID=6347 RepID=A0A8S4NI54_OWEFU|nr:unnamed protein product [Owenia fusiformis]
MKLAICCLVLMLTLRACVAVSASLKLNPKFQYLGVGYNGIENRYLVIFRTGFTKVGADMHFNKLKSTMNIQQGHIPKDNPCASGTIISELIPHDMIYIISCPSEQILRLLLNDNDITRIVQDTVVSTQQCSNINAYTLPNPSSLYWNLDRINQENPNPVDGFYSVLGNGMGVDLYVIDSGIRSQHDEFTNRIDSAGYNFVDGNSSPEDDMPSGHGTLVSGIAAGTNTGVCKMVTIIPFKAIGADGTGSAGDLIAAIRKAIDLKATRNRPAVINISLGTVPYAQLDVAVKSAVKSGIFVSVGAGNFKKLWAKQSPARAPKAFTVASVGKDDNLSWFSNFGAGVDIAAPGEDIYSASNACDNCYTNGYGTSYAAPQVAGVAACYLSVYPTATVPQVEAYLRNGSWKDKIGNIGGGVNPGTPNRILRSNKC